MKTRIHPPRRYVGRCRPNQHRALGRCRRLRGCGRALSDREEKVRASLQTILGRPAADLVWKRPSNKIDDILKIAKPEWRIIPPCKPCRRDVVAAFKIATDKLKTFAQAIVSIPEE